MVQTIQIIYSFSKFGTWIIFENNHSIVIFPFPGRYSPDRLISDLRSRLEKEKRDDATNAKVSSLTRGQDGRIVMNIKEETEKGRPRVPHNTRKKRRETTQSEAGGGSRYLGEVYSDLTDQVDTRLSRPSSRRSSPRWPGPL